ncbi:MAG: dephospho-CoA kinase [Clostridia bacterium]|jgi:dephospho-CoA kinase|nr:dephospho-CoA kinase [Clostridia bacterium]
MSKYVIGLTGGIACGKSNISRSLKEAGVPVIDADEISRSLTASGGPALPAIREKWGEKVFDGEELNRRALSDIVFSDPAAREALNAIIHPLVLSEIHRKMDETEGPVVMDVPLLYEVGMDSWCDEIWCAYAPQKEQVRRVRKRGRITYAEALRRIHSQMPVMEKRRRADHMIRTTGTKEESGRAALSLWQDAVKRASETGGNKRHE